MQLTFWGAAGTVTGSMHELRAGGERILLDCGLYQGKRFDARERNSHLPFEAREIDRVLLSHAHIDHSGNLPSLTKHGFSGPIHATPATADLCGSMLRDSAHIQEKDVEFLRRRLQRRRRVDPKLKDDALEPIYTMADADAAIDLFRKSGYHQLTQVNDGVSYEAYDTGHLLGSSALVMKVQVGGKTIRLAFSGDVGRENLPILRDPEEMPPVDYLILESTYGGRIHKDDERVKDRLADVISDTAARGGRVVVPAFAVGRTQQLVYLLHQLTLEQRIPEIPIFVDSPLAIDATEIHGRHPECFDREIRALLEAEGDPFAFRRLKYTRLASESKALNDLPYPYVVISASGMCESGRILHHLRNNIADSRSTILITGFQAEQTLGRKILEGRKEVPIFGEYHQVHARVERMNELSGHADQMELLCWVKPMAETLKKVFLVHGEPEQAKSLKTALRELLDVEAHVAVRGDVVELD